MVQQYACHGESEPCFPQRPLPLKALLDQNRGAPVFYFSGALLQSPGSSLSCLGLGLHRWRAQGPADMLDEMGVGLGEA